MHYFCRSGFNQPRGDKGDPGFPGPKGLPGRPVRKHVLKFLLCCCFVFLYLCKHLILILFQRVQLVKQVFQVEKERRESRIPLVLLGQREKKGTRDSLGGLGIRVYLDFQDCQVAKAIQGFQGIR